jgi:hypothetical protein
MAVRSRIRQGTEESRQRSLLITPIEPVSELGRLNLEHNYTMPSSGMFLHQYRFTTML